MAISLTRYGVAAVEVEATYGTRPTMLASTHGIKLIDSGVPMPFQGNNQIIRAQSASLASRKRIPTTRLWTPQITTPLTGGTNATTKPRWVPLAQAAGFTYTLGPPMVIGLSTTGAVAGATIVTEQGNASDKITRESNGTRGSLRIFASIDQEPRVGFTGQGIYKAQTHGTIVSVLGAGAWSPGPEGEYSALLTGADRLKINNGGTDYFGKVNAWNLSSNSEIVPCTSLNAGATGGLDALIFDDWDPQIEINFKQDPASGATVTDKDFYDDLIARTAHNIDFKWTDGLGRTFTFDITGVPIQVAEVVDGVFIGVNVTYEITTLQITHA